MGKLLFSSRRWSWILLVFVVLVVIGIAGFFVVPRTRAAPEQPIEFDHKSMVQVGIDCLFCHSEARRSPVAGIPSLKKCMGCHAVIDTDKPGIKELAGYWERQEPIPWVRVYRLPRFVYFSHEVHIAKAINCERCHGEVGKMDVARPVVRINMGWCLKCHEQQPNASQLKDCVVCHQ